MFLITHYTYAFPAMTWLNIYCEKGVLISKTMWLKLNLLKQNTNTKKNKRPFCLFFIKTLFNIHILPPSVRGIGAVYHGALRFITDTGYLNCHCTS